MDAPSILKLRSHRSSNADAGSEKTKNRKLIDAALREAEVLRHQSAQLGRVWKHNVVLLRSEREHRQNIDQLTALQSEVCTAQVKDLHDHLDEMDSHLRSLQLAHGILSSSVTKYESLCQTALRESELLEMHVATLRNAKQSIMDAMSSRLENARETLSSIEMLMKSVDAELEEEENLNLQLKLSVGLGE